MDESGGLENRWGATSRGFESLPLRHSRYNFCGIPCGHGRQLVEHHHRMHRALAVVGLLILVAGPWLSHTQAANENPDVVIDGKTDAGRRYLMQLHNKTVSRDCHTWQNDDPRVLAVVPLKIVTHLWIGTRYSDVNGLGVQDIHKTYVVDDVSVGGTRLQGVVKIRIPTIDVESEQPCFDKMVGLTIKGHDETHKGVYDDTTWEMTVTEVKIQFLIKPRNTNADDLVETGEALVTILFREEYQTMVFRKTVEHLWALPGSLALMILWAFSAWSVKKIRIKGRCCCR